MKESVSTIEKIFFRLFKSLKHILKHIVSDAGYKKYLTNRAHICHFR